IVNAHFQGANLEQTNIDSATFRAIDFPYSTKDNLSATGSSRASGVLTYDQTLRDKECKARGE
ncbi:hypothetical protein ACR9PT_15305, partial [Piscirickettsia salmonis]|uniref:hypothetical protein n=1 Tax=Piscirickettsia salmonis TaxID=1238 RepID=UPI003EBEBE2C